MISEDDQRGAGVKFPPPLVVLLTLIVAYGAHYIFPLHLGAPHAVRILGIIPITVAISLVIYIARIFAQAETNIEPWKPTTEIITSGVFAYSRNPIYAGFCLIPIGLGLLLNSIWLLISFVPMAFIIYHVAIKHEEAYLEKKFADEYSVYKKHVRRWV